MRRLLIERRLPAALRSEAALRLTDIVTPLVTPTGAWFDGDPVPARDALLLEALRATVQEIGTAPRPQAWRGAHPVVFVHPLAVGERGRQRFNVGPFQVPGYADTVFAVTPTTGPALQVIFDTGDWDRSVGINAPGQSGAAASPHYADMASQWATSGYVPLPFSDEAVKAGSEAVLVLTPRQ